MIAVLGEHKSDVETIAIIVKRLLDNPKAHIKKKGFNGCGELCNKGARQIRQFARLGADRFVVVHDADGPNPQDAYAKVLARIVRPADVEDADTSCIVIPVEELEAWLLADEEAVAKVIPSFIFKPVESPERQKNPKERLEHLSRMGQTKPKYAHAVHNPRVAEHLSFDKVGRKCPSFLPLRDFVEKLR